MNLKEFQIGSEFSCSSKRWRCTDIGSRVIVAIFVEYTEVTTRGHGEVTTHRFARDEAEAAGYLDGPPYAVVEHVFDEHEQEGCEPIKPVR